MSNLVSILNVYQTNQCQILPNPNYPIKLLNIFQFTKLIKFRLKTNKSQQSKNRTF